MGKLLNTILVLSIWEDVWSLGEGGGVSDELHFIRYLTDRGIDLHFLIPEPREKRELLRDAHLSYHTFPNIFRRFDRIPKLAKRLLWPSAFTKVVLKQLRHLAVEKRPDIIIGFSHYSLQPLNRIGRELGIPTVVKLFGVMYLDRFDFPKLKYWWKNFEQILALRHPVDHYIVLNDGTRGNIALTRLGIPPDKISFLPNGMDTEWADVHVDRAEVRRTMGLPTDGILVVEFARLVKSKRIELFLKVASMIDPTLAENVTFVVGGDGPERKRLEREVLALGLKERMIFTGVIPHREIVKFLKASDIFVGTNEFTNMSLPPCEAILCGVPVVAFDNSGTSEVVRDGETGLLVEDGDVEGLAKKVETLIKDEELRKRLGRQAAAFGRRYFVSWDERISMELEALEKLITDSID